MSVLETFNTRMKDAMKRKDAKELALLRMVKSRFQLRLTEKGVVGPLTDEMAVEEIGKYVKQITKSLPDFEKAGERGKEKVAAINYEINYLAEFLPKMLDEAQTEALVADKIKDLGVVSPNEIGKVMGAVMKDHKGLVDAGLCKQIATRLLTTK